MRRSQKLLPCLTEPMPAKSKMDPPLPKAKPISDGSSASRTRDLRNGEKAAQQEVGERSETV